MPTQPNLLFILADQLRAASLPAYGEDQIHTPNLDRLTREGTTLTNAIATCPLCTPYRAMLLTGRHPQTTGHIHNSIRTRHSEISIADALAHQGYRTGWIGKWHLHTGNWPSNWAPDWVPAGRDRLGFQFWRAYNMHMNYFDGFVQLGEEDWAYEQWDDYETLALNRYAFAFMDDVKDAPFALVLSPHQPHWGAEGFAPDAYYDRLPSPLQLPANVPEDMVDEARQMARHYLAMTLTLDDMLGDLLDYLDRTGLAENTLVVFTSDHGSQVGAHGVNPWEKRRPYEESLHVPCVMRLPGTIEAGASNDTLTAPVDLFPSLCGLLGVPIPRTVEGRDLSQAWLGRDTSPEQEGVLTMNFSSRYDHIAGGLEWRGVRTKRYTYARWLSGREELYDLEADPLQMENLVEDPDRAGLRRHLRGLLADLQHQHGDALVPCESYRDWYDSQRRVVRNAYGPLSHPESPPDWSLLI